MSFTLSTQQSAKYFEVHPSVSPGWHIKEIPDRRVLPEAFPFFGSFAFFDFLFVFSFFTVNILLLPNLILPCSR